MRVRGRASEREAERRGGEEREGACSRSLWVVRTGNNVRVRKGQSTCLAGARQNRGCAGSGSSTDILHEKGLTGPMYQPPSLCRDYRRRKVSRLNEPSSE